jgi:PIN domain nuclease of toxin-antitoxin system
LKYLLDTHALLWWLSDDKRLGPSVRKTIANPSSDILVSAASFWEIVVKMRVGKITADIDDIVDAVDDQGFNLVNIRPEHLRVLVNLPIHHRDPFDHLLIAQAIVEKAIFISEDASTPKYPVSVLKCS